MNDDIIVYAKGPMVASVCVHKDITKKEIELYMNTYHYTGISSDWSISKDKTFESGETNPCPCNKFPNNRLHYLLNC